LLEIHYSVVGFRQRFQPLMMKKGRFGGLGACPPGKVANLVSVKCLFLYFDIISDVFWSCYLEQDCWPYGSAQHAVLNEETVLLRHYTRANVFTQIAKILKISIFPFVFKIL